MVATLQTLIDSSVAAAAEAETARECGGSEDIAEAEERGRHARELIDQRLTTLRAYADEIDDGCFCCLGAQEAIDRALDGEDRATGARTPE